MKLMLTSFGIEQSIAEQEQADSMFRRMPPVSFRRFSGTFMPDFELLLLCDKILMDGASFGYLVNSAPSAYSVVADTMNVLRGEGRIELVDFVSILRNNTQLLDRMLEHDIKVLDQWVKPLRESLNAWRTFIQDSNDIMHQMVRDTHAPEGSRPGDEDLHFQRAYMHEQRHAYNLIAHSLASQMHHAMHEARELTLLVDEALSSSEKRRRKEYRSALQQVLRSYLAYVNANLVLANELDVPFHDWLDFTPFYNLKFLSVGQESELEKAHDQMSRLFSISFPQLAIADTRSLVRALNDKRIEDLRRLVNDAVQGRVTFDEEFANCVLREVLSGEFRAGKVRRVLGYATMPVGFIPWIGTPVQKLLEEAVGTPLEHRIKREHRWFYLLSEIADSKKSAGAEPKEMEG